MIGLSRRGNIRGRILRARRRNGLRLVYHLLTRCAFCELILRQDEFENAVQCIAEFRRLLTALESGIGFKDEIRSFRQRAVPLIRFEDPFEPAIANDPVEFKIQVPLRGFNILGPLLARFSSAITVLPVSEF